MGVSVLRGQGVGLPTVKVPFWPGVRNLQFLDNSLKTVLSEYRDYFRERFVEGLSIRKYAEAYQLNRGSVDYLQKKFFSALARLLKERDEAEGKCRLRKPAQN